ncbi:hypothetical protein VaNZ11_006795 [Volvox africanus]|uniref:Citrate transporter-like domain-containing protein n=1 Tax=Volvox africanus TaxID=51714 RepID=A0ABQ5S1G6_9CHLO|nr:hypothetical protein VaNZ11_006795 [Volvox africanus]
MKTPFHGALSLLVFLLTIICTYALSPQGVKVRIPRTHWSVFISFCWIPWVSTALLIIFQAITFKEVGVALTGAGGLRPSSIIVTYISLAYLAISCEITGLYAWLALHAARWTRGRPFLLLAVFFGLSGALTAATGPDVSLVALTPIVVYTASAANLDPMSMSATHMGAASIWSMLVPVAGPINIIAAHAFQLTFIDFLGWMALPTSAAAIVVFLLLCVLLHRRHLATVRHDVATSTLPYPDPGVMLHDQVGAACCSALLVGCLLALAVGPWLRWSGWLVAAVFALVAALYNLAASVGPLRAAIGRRSAYERRRRLQAELAQQGLHRVVSDEDLADLLLSAAQDRDASFTRLTTANANRIPAGVTPACTSLGSGGGTGSTAQRRSMYGSGWGFGGLGSRPAPSSLISGGGSSSSLGYSLPSLASFGSGGGGAAAADAAGVSPLRQWLSLRWSSFRGFFVTTGASSELVAAAADARADLRILRECIACVPAPAAAETVAAEPPPPAAIDGLTYSAAAAGAKCGIVESAGAGDRFDLGGGRRPSLPLVGSELHQLLTHGTSAAQDTLEWWAAAALAAHELVAAQQEKLAVDTPAGVATVQQLAAGNCVNGDGVGGAAAGSAGRGAIGGDTFGGSLTSVSPFANQAAMCFPDWDGHPAAASAMYCNGTTNAGAAYRRQNAASGRASHSLDGDGDGAMRMEDSQRRQVSHGNISTSVANHRAGAGTGAAQVDNVLGDNSRDSCGAYVRGSGSGGGGGDVIEKWKAAYGRAKPRCTANVSSGNHGSADAPGVIDDTGGTGNHGSGRGAADAPPACCDDPAWKLDHRLLGFAAVQSSPGQLPSSHFPHPQRSPRPHRSGSLPLGGLYGSQDERGSEQGDHAVTAFVPPAGRDAVAATDPGVPLLGHHPPIPPPSSSTGVSFEGLFGCWRRRGTVLDSMATEMVELLPARAAASDDPCHVVRVSPTPVAWPPPSGGAGKPIVDPATSLKVESAPYISLPDCRSKGHAPLLSGLAGGPYAPAATAAAGCSGLADTRRLHPVKEPSKCRRSPFPSSVNIVTAAGTVRASTVGGGGGGGGDRGGMGHDGDVITGDDRSLDGGCGSGLNRYEGFGACGGVAAAASWSRYKLRRPSAALLMLGSSEVGFLGTFAALPWANTVLLLGWFVLVEAMQVHGWIDALARFLTTIATVKEPTTSSIAYSTPAGASNPITTDADATGASGGSSAGAIAGAVFAIGWLSALLSIGMTGQLAALLLARVAMRPEFLAALQPVAAAASETTLTTGLISLTTNNNNTAAATAAIAASATSGVRTAAATAAAVTNRSGSGFLGFGAVQRGAQLALVIAANIAPALSLSGSLTALRWGLGLRSLGVRMQYCKYMVSGLAPAVLVGTVAALLALWGQCVVLP